MSEHIVGMMWNRNEDDILAQTIESALENVDSLFIADDGSTDKSWDIIQSFAKARPDKIEHIRQEVDARDKGQRQAMLDEIRKRYKPENTWVQIIESDIMILDTDIRGALAAHASLDIALSWQCLNALRHPGEWTEYDTYPHWGLPIRKVMPQAHWMEVMLYTFRPLPKLQYNQDTWRPWPQGFSHYSNGKDVEIRRKFLDAPLLAHYGYRGPTHFYKKFKAMGKNFHSKYKSWDLRSPESVEKTVAFFNGDWSKDNFPMSRLGWISYRKG